MNFVISETSDRLQWRHLRLSSIRITDFVIPRWTPKFFHIKRLFLSLLGSEQVFYP